MSGWQPVAFLPSEGWVIGKRQVSETSGHAPAFVGQPYENPFFRGSNKKSLIDPWTGKWVEITAWMPIPENDDQ